MIAYGVAAIGLIVLYGGVMAVGGLDLNFAVIQDAIVGRG